VDLSVRRQCALLNLARSGVYRPKPVIEAGDLALMRRIVPEQFGGWKNTHRRFRPPGQDRGMTESASTLGRGCQQLIRHDRRHHRPGAPAQRRRSQKKMTIRPESLDCRHCPQP
jgi:hypothetical protein